jgi:hypothetical protein
MDFSFAMLSVFALQSGSAVDEGAAQESILDLTDPPAGS